MISPPRRRTRFVARTSGPRSKSHAVFHENATLLYSSILLIHSLLQSLNKFFPSHLRFAFTDLTLLQCLDISIHRNVIDDTHTPAPSDHVRFDDGELPRGIEIFQPASGLDREPWLLREPFSFYFFVLHFAPLLRNGVYNLLVPCTVCTRILGLG